VSPKSPSRRDRTGQILVDTSDKLLAALKILVTSSCFNDDMDSILKEDPHAWSTVNEVYPNKFHTKNCGIRIVPAVRFWVLENVRPKEWLHKTLSGPIPESNGFGGKASDEFLELCGCSGEALHVEILNKERSATYNLVVTHTRGGDKYSLNLHLHVE
jgi:hypothetical protein